MQNLLLPDIHPVIEQSARGYFLLNQHLFALQDQLTPVSDAWHGRMDARRQALNALATPCIGGALMIFNMLSVLGRNPALQEFASLADIKAEPNLKQQAYNHLVMFSVAGTVLLFQFQIENLFENLWRALGKDRDGQYWRLAMNLLDRLELRTESRVSRLRFLKDIRNSLHNNGIHAYPSWSLEIDVHMETGLGPINLSGTHSFAQNEIVEVTPLIVLAAFCGALEVVVDIFSSDPIAEIPGPIPDLLSSSALI